VLLLAVVAIPKKKSGSELADEHNTVFDVGGPFWIVAMLSMIFPFSLVQSFTLQGTHDVMHPVSTIRFVTAQIIDAKKSTLVTSLENS